MKEQERKGNCMGQKIGKKIIGGLDSAVDFITLVLILLVLLLGGYSLWDSQAVYAAADAVNYTKYKPAEDNTVSFQDLMKKNREIIAWLTVNNTHIDYPVVQYRDNVKYLNTDAFGNYNLAGALFLDCENAPDFSDFNSIIFGHHMDKKEMFGELTDFAEQSYFDAHRYGSLWYGGEAHEIEWFSYMETDAYDDRLYIPGLKTYEDRSGYLKSIKEKSKHMRDAGVTVSDRLVVLSTCSSYQTNGRSILVGKLK